MHLFIVLLIGIIAVKSAIIPLVKEVPNYRLRTDVKPSHYDIHISPYLEVSDGPKQFTFIGITTIHLKTDNADITSFDIHIKFLNITKVNIESSEISVRDKTYNNETEIQTINLNQPLVIGVTYKFTFEYSGVLHDDMHGLYRSSYVEQNEIIWIASTQFQPTHARKVFPCFDEPSFKATFNLTITKPITYGAVSNAKPTGPAIISDIDVNRNIVTFERTPIMSTYLLAFIVSKFSNRTNDEKNFSVYARPEANLQTEYSFEVGQKILSELSKFTKIDYYSVEGVTKLDMAALPDFNAGAMENWGLLTYRETYLLYLNETSTSMAKQKIASIVAHEQAHMWFGDLVTCEWWEHTWLNEGFARYFEYHGTALVEKNWELEKQFVIEQVQTAFVLDSTENTHPMSSVVNSPSEISAIFDNISYNKGAAVITMIEHLIGTDKFKNALNAYLNDRRLNYTKPEYLFQHLNVSDEFDVASIMPQWTQQSGYPLIHVHVDDTRQKATISQKRFLLNKPKVEDKTTWSIPLTFVSKNGNFGDTKPKGIFKNNTKEMQVNINAKDTWVIFNIKQSGYYRVTYDDKSWDYIKDGLAKSNHDNIHELNRAQIVDDLFNLARAGEISYNFVFQTIQYLKGESNYLPWLSTFNNFAFLSRRMDQSALNLFKAHIEELVENIYKKLGFDVKPNESTLDIYNRANVLNWACKSGNPSCITEAQKRFKTIQSNPPSKIPADIRSVVYCTAMREGGMVEFNVLWNKYQNENVASEQIVILNAIGCSRSKDVLTKYLDNILSNDVRLQDKSAAFTSTFINTEENLPTVFAYVMENHIQIAESFKSTSQVATFLAAIAERFTQKSQIDELAKFADENSECLGSSKSKVDSALTEATFNLDWIKKNIPVITHYIDSLRSAAHSITLNLLLVITGVVFKFFFLKIY